MSDQSGATERLTVTVEEAGRLLGIGRGTAYEAVRSGDIPSVRIGRRVLVPRHALLALLGHQKDEGRAA
jgi:excisionase family DNA binding protein